ncbi:hypothetical protein PENNAL_c0013G01328 [Penicillium nalgiovense]|uniref:Uncharacterized protein n=1 Tax=Penicillium nalgiovense TaxID=60175 RepID=A0A1V6YQY3_PENNA|nr:hypothetical protein PENNAL_c0013G01328 [Penicillium nalgiovense]
MSSNERIEGPFELPGEPMESHTKYHPTTDKTGIHVTEAGRIDIDWNSKFVRGFSVLSTGPFLGRPATPPPEYSELPTQNADSPSVGPERTSICPEPSTENRKAWHAKLNIVIQVVGSRGDVQPFIALGNELTQYGHRVRLATHDVFEDFVRDSGLEFYPIGGDPAELMAYMVKSTGLIPSMESLRTGEIRRKRIMIREMLDGCWSSCIEPDMVTNHPFVADAIIANPPSFAHVHCAQALSIPVHLMFTMPWSTTKSFPHPLANMNAEDAQSSLKNQVSYDIVNWLTWQGVGDVINGWRKDLDLDEVATFEGPRLAELLKVPFTYCWSPALVPKPVDWPSHVDVCGFFFRDPPQFEPPLDLQAFLSSGPPPIYIGFGSIVLEDQVEFTATIIEAVNTAGVRAIISKGWSNLSGTNTDKVHFIGDCPHEWLFQHVAAVVHHGGAGTTACGLRNGKPTIIIPFFGDQPFWGTMVAAAGAGPNPIPHKDLSVDILAQGIRKIKVSKLAAAQLIAQGLLDPKQLKMHALNPIIIENRRWDPITGGASAVLGTTTDLTASILGLFYKPFEEYQDYQVSHRDRPLSSKSSQTTNGSNCNSTGDCSLQMTKEAPDNIPSAFTNDRASTANSLSSSGSSSSRHRARLAGKMAGASIMSVANFVPTALKGMTVDIPLAMTEGMRNIPRLYGEEPRDHGPVTGVKSGFALAGKGFACGMAEAVSDLVVKPYEGVRKDGAKGAVKGVGKGIANMTSKAGCATFGVLVYPSAGIAKSLKSALYTGTRKRILKARHAEGTWLLENGGLDGMNSDISAFQRVIKGKKT